MQADTLYKGNLYAYCHNSPISNTDEYGFESYKAYDSPELAAYHFVLENHPLTLNDGKERMAIIYSKTEWDKNEAAGQSIATPKTVYYYGDVHVGAHTNVIIPFIIEYIASSIFPTSTKNTPKMYSYVHTHPRCKCHKKGGLMFSPADEFTARLFKSKKIYLGSALGDLRIYEKHEEGEDDYFIFSD